MASESRSDEALGRSLPDSNEGVRMVLHPTPRHPSPSLYGSEFSSVVQDDIPVADVLQAIHGIGDGRNARLETEDALATELDQMLGAHISQVRAARNG